MADVSRRAFAPGAVVADLRESALRLAQPARGRRGAMAEGSAASAAVVLGATVLGLILVLAGAGYLLRAAGGGAAHSVRSVESALRLYLPGGTPVTDVLVGLVVLALARSVLARRPNGTWVAVAGLGGLGFSAVIMRVGPWSLGATPYLGDGVLAIALLFVRYSLPTDPTPNRHPLVAGLVDRPGGDTLDPFADRVDKVHYVHPETGGVIGYRARFGVALASGCPLLPVGAPGLSSAGSGADALAVTLAGFLAHCRAYRLRPAIIGLDTRAVAAARRAGMHAIYVGDEALVRTEGFRLDLPSMRNVRQATKRSANFGVTTEVRLEAEVDAGLRAELAELAEEARGPAPERGFSMTFSDTALTRPECVIVTGRDAEGRLIAVQRYAPCMGGRALSLDLMRRRPRSPNGVNERMIVDTVAWAAEHGFDHVSLNFATFKTLMDLGDERNRLQRVEYWLVHLLDRWIKVESLYRFNAKFHPEWLARWVAFASVADLPAVLVAALVAEFGPAGTTSQP
ncbi:MAG: bifunctional lysylphosphatidylglycerol flippase/synthetase MprF [Acidimicrobiales bacterium]